MTRSLILMIAFSLALVVNANAQTEKPAMKKFWFVLLKDGTNKDTSNIAAVRKSHFANIERMSKLGILKVAGPFDKNDQHLRGIFIIDAENKERVIQELQGDEAISKNHLVAEILEWWTMTTGSFADGLKGK